MLAPFGHEGLFKAIQCFEPGIDIDLGGFQQDTQPKAANPDLVARKAKFSRKTNGLASAVHEELGRSHHIPPLISISDLYPKSSALAMVGVGRSRVKG